MHGTIINLITYTRGWVVKHGTRLLRLPPPGNPWTMTDSKRRFHWLSGGPVDKDTLAAPDRCSPPYTPLNAFESLPNTASPVQTAEPSRSQTAYCTYGRYNIRSGILAFSILAVACLVIGLMALGVRFVRKRLFKVRIRSLDTPDSLRS